MQFKKIEVFGFKSFADRLEIFFEPGVTAIVGPNGCGKSNVVDAVRWVLGEQSAKLLRGSKMEDVIFNGTEERKMLGFAEVILTLDNSLNILPIDYAEVSVTRRLFRSGESEYLLNNIPCRLKDIDELFMDTGMGISNYSIIEQGRIDLLLSSKPEDRRLIFDEVAGVAKYRAKKEAALRKLEATEQNLLRLNDSILEMKRHINFIKREAGKAERYQNLQEELKTLHLKLSRDKYVRLKEEGGGNCAESEELRRKIDAEKIEIETHNTHLEEVNIKVAEIERKVSEFGSKKAMLTSSINHEEKKIAIFKEQVSTVKMGREKAEAEVIRLHGKIAEAETNISEIETEIVKLKETLENENKKLTRKEEKAQEMGGLLTKIHKDIEEKKTEIVDIFSKKSRLTNEISNHKHLSASTQMEIAKNSSEEEGLTKTKDSIKEKLADREKFLQMKREELDSLKEKDKSMETEIERLNLEGIEASRILRELREEFTAQNSRFSVLYDMKQNYEGFEAGVRSIVLSAREDKGFMGVVADIAEIPLEFATPIEAAMGQVGVQGVIVETQEEAIRGIDWLASANSGRATFFALDRVMPPQREEKIDEILNSNPNIKEAVKIVKFEKRAENVFRFLLENVLIVEDVQTALKACGSNGKNLTFVTMRGDVVRPLGVITGGSSNGSTGGLLRRSAEVRELTQKVQSLKEEVDDKTYREEEYKLKLSTLTKLHEENLSTIHSIEISITDLTKDILVYRADIDRLELEISVLQLEVKGLKEDEGNAERGLTLAIQSLKRVEEEIETSQTNITKVEVLFAKRVQEREVISNEITELKVSIAGFSEKMNSLFEILTHLRQGLRENSTNIQVLKNDIETLETKEKEISESIVQAEKAIASLGGAMEKVDVLLKKAFGEKNEKLELIDQHTKMVKEGYRRVEEVKTALSEVELKGAEIQMEITSLKEKVFAEYKTTFEDILSSEGTLPEEEKSAVRTRVNDLEEKLKSFGQVSLFAIEDHRGSIERHSFYTKQYADLMTAREQVKDAIQRINRQARAEFSATFEQVRAAFRDIFQIMFEGGGADLRLVDETDPLASGIEIVACPPGKKLQSISLLSGGERALTALGVLFAIHRIKPSPFCILDEADAPLDEASIGRFLRVLEEFIGKSQFIIITHNKRTVGFANVMYGIVMEEKGVSKMVSVKFGDKITKITRPSEAVLQPA